MKITLTDAGILELYSMWSEENYSVSFIGASPQMVKDFRTWMWMVLTAPDVGLYDYELEMLGIFREQEMEEAPID